MTTTDTTTSDLDLTEDGPDEDEQLTPEAASPRDAAPKGTQMRTLSLSALAPHPDNPRSDLGDLTELERSIKANGVLVPLLVLPGDDDGVHLIVAGHRRHAASGLAGIDEVPVMERAMTRVEAIEAMLSENVNRDALTVADEVRAIERLMSLDGALTPTKLCRRIGKSQAWVRSRMAVTILPAQWREALDSGGLSLASGEAASTAADLGPEHLDAVCEQLAGGRWHDPAREVARYRDDLKRKAAYNQAVEAERSAGATVYTRDEDTPKRAKRVDEMFTGSVRGDHASEPCHAVMLKRISWGDGISRHEMCTDPRRHSPKSVESGKGSTIAADRRSPVDTESSHQKRKGRLARLAHATEYFSKTRGGPSQATLVSMALRSLVFEAGREPLMYAATILGHENPKDVSPEKLLDGVKTAAAFARVAGAVACGLAEDDMYWAMSGNQCTEWLDLLCDSGWVPDVWTASVIQAREERRSRHAQVNDPEGDDPAGSLVDEDQSGDEVGEQQPHPGDELGDEASPVGDEVGEQVTLVGDESGDDEPGLDDADAQPPDEPAAEAEDSAIAADEEDVAVGDSDGDVPPPKADEGEDEA